MTATQRYISYALVIFLMCWGLDLINSIKFNIPITAKDIFHPLLFTQATYSFVTFWACRKIFSRIIPRQRYRLLLPALLLLIVIFIFTRYLLEQVFIPLLTNLENYPKGVSFFYYILDNIYYSLIYITLGGLLYSLDMQLKQQKQQAELVQRSKEAELQLLRSQVQPHFLFNTLNNIYSLVYNQSPQAPGAVLQLSGLMRYLLYEKKEKVALKKEWEYVHHYIALQQLRLEQPATIEETTEGDWESSEVPPYLFIAFIENAFKHGDFRKGPLVVKIARYPQRLVFTCSNPVGRHQKDEAGGIGLENVRRRLDLLYPLQHELHIQQGDIFSIQMTLTTT